MRCGLILVAAAGCSTGPPTDSEPTTEVPPFELTSPVFEEGGTIPLVHECGAPFVPNGPGDNDSPPLAWTAGPEGTGSYTVVLRDLDYRPADYPDGLIHWAIYDIPADVLALPEGVPEGESVADPAGAMQGEVQGSGLFGYFGPCSPNSVNTYSFTVYAMPGSALDLDGDESEINVADVAARDALEQASLDGES